MTATPIQITRRPPNGVAGAPPSSLSGQLFYNMADGTFYVGYGDDGTGHATSIKAWAKDDFSVSYRLPAGGTTGQLLAKNSNTDRDASWINAPLNYVGGSGITVSGSTIAIDGSVVATQTNLALKAPLASPALTGTPTAPTAAAGTASTQVATTAFVNGAITALVNGAPAALDTLAEIASQMASDESGVAALTTTVGGKLTKTSNLSDLSDANAARGNLGLGSLSLQASSAITVTGGSMTGVSLTNCPFDGGTF